MPDTEFEQAFADMAYSRLQEEGQSLMPYSLGFEVVDKNEQGSKALGIYVFKLNDLIIYAPAHFINGVVKPMVSLYLPKQDLFLPLTDDQVNDLLKQPSMQLGEPVSQKGLENFAQPSLENLITPPRTGRYVAASDRQISRKKFTEWVTKQAMLGLETKKLKDDVLITFCREHPRFASSFFTQNHGLLKHAANFGVLDSLLKAINEGTELLVKRAEDLPKTKEKVIEEDSGEYVATVRNLPEKKKKKAIRNKFVVREDNDSEQQLYGTEYQQEFQNPQRNGVYLVLTHDGNLEPCMVFLNPTNVNSHHAVKGSIVYSLDGSQACVAPTNKVWVTKNKTVDDCSAFFKKGKTFSEVRPNKSYFLAAPFAVGYQSGKCSVPFMVMNKVSTTGSGDYLCVHCIAPYEVLDSRTEDHNSLRDNSTMGFMWETQRGDPSETPYTEHPREGDPFSTPYDTKLYMTEADSDHLVQHGSGLAVPAPYSFFEFPCECGDGNLKLGDMGTLRLILMYKKGFQTLRVRSDNSEHYMSLSNSPWKSFLKKAALAKELSEMGFNKLAVDRVIEDLQENREHRYLTKVSYFHYNPAIQTESSSQYPVQYFNETYQTLEPAVHNRPARMPGMANNLYYGPDHSSTPGGMTGPALGDMLAQLGDRQVFEHGILGTLATTTSTLDKVNSYIPDLTSAVDKLGRILFLFWHKAEDFQKIYQVNEYSKYEDLIVDTFKNLGDIILSLKKKSIPKNLELEMASGN